VKALVENCPRLVSLSLFSLDITDDALLHITEKCKALVSLSVSGCTQVTDQGAATISRLPNLQSLYLNGATITDKSLVSIASQCRLLRALSLNDCVDLTDRTAICLATWCPNLQSLSLNRCNVTPVGVKALISRCADLRELSVKDCAHFTFLCPGVTEPVRGTGGYDGLAVTAEMVLQLSQQRRLALIK
jgi:F-box and leucine-rich repeat protein GRR1